MNLAEIGALAQTLGVVGLLVFALVGGIKGLWVFGATHREIVQNRDDQLKECKVDRDEWKQIALAGISTAEKATTVAARSVGS